MMPAPFAAEHRTHSAACIASRVFAANGRRCGAWSGRDPFCRACRANDEEFRRVGVQRWPQ